MPPDSPPKRQPSTSPMLNRGTSTITTTRHLSLAGGPSPFQPSRAPPGPARGRRRASVSERRQSAGVCVERGPSLVDKRRERLQPSRQVNRQRQPGQLAVDLVVLVDDEVPVGDGQCPFDAVGTSTSSRDNRFAASPSFIISESPASCRRSSAR